MVDVGSYFAARRIHTTLMYLTEALAAIRLDNPLDQRDFNALDEARAKMRLVEVWLRGQTGLLVSSPGSESAEAPDGTKGQPPRARVRPGAQDPDLSF